MEKILYGFRDLSGGLYTASDETRMPPNALQTATNVVYDKDSWKRKGGRAKYNATYMHATLDVRGLFKFATTGADSMLAVCNGSFYKTTGDGSMGSALTMPDVTAVAMATAAFDVYAPLYDSRLWIFTGDTTDYPYIYNGTNIIDTARTATGTADSGDTTTFVDAVLTEANDYWNGLPIKLTDITDNTVHYSYVSDFDAGTDTVTIADTCTFNIDVGDTYTIGFSTHTEKNGKYAIVFKDRIFSAVGGAIYYTLPYYPTEYTEGGTLNIKYPGKDDGELITGLAGMGDYLVVFKPHHIYVYLVVGNKDSWNMEEVKGDNASRGAVWHRTIDVGFGGLIYMSYDGVYVLDTSLNVRCISRNIEPTIKALVQSMSNPAGMNVVTKIDTTKANFDAGTDTNIDTATVSGTFRVAKTTEATDQTYTTGGDNNQTNRLGALAQSFTTSKAQICTKIELYLKKTGSPSDLTVYLKSDDNNSPGDTLASATIAAADVATTYAYEIANITDTNLATTTKYWIYLPQSGDADNLYWWQSDITSPTYTGGNLWFAGGHQTDRDLLFKVYYQTYESSSNLISQIHDIGAVPTNWATFVATETLNGCTVAWTVRSDDDSGMASPTAFTAVENGGTPSITLQRYVQWKATFTPTNTATPVVDDVTIRAYTGTAVVAPCGKVYDKSYWLSVIDTPEGDTTNSCVYWLDEEAWLYEQKERWSKLDGIYANYFTIFNDQLISGSVGGTGLGGFLYYESTGTKDITVNFTSTLITKKDDFNTLNPIYANRKKVYLKIDAKYKSNVASSLYYKVDEGDWSSALSLSAKADTGVERESFSGLQTGRYLTIKWVHASADNIYEIHGCDIETIIKPYI